MKRRKPKHVELIFKTSTPSNEEREFFISDDFRQLLFDLDCRVILDNLQRENFSSSNQVTWHCMNRKAYKLINLTLKSLKEMVLRKDEDKIHVFLEG